MLVNSGNNRKATSETRIAPSIKSAGPCRAMYLGRKGATRMMPTDCTAALNPIHRLSTPRASITSESNGKLKP